MKICEGGRGVTTTRISEEYLALKGGGIQTIAANVKRREEIVD